jgi:uncharacterized protein YqgV (UPF0045/DUF77 family)
MGVVTRCFETMAAECPRVSVNIKIDYRAGPAGRLQSKVATVEQLLGRELKT